MLIDDHTVQGAVTHLSAHDPMLKPVIRQVGPCTVRPHTDYYQELVDAVVSQQLSVKAANAIENRLRSMFGGSLPSPEQILRADPEALRGCGLSQPKVSYIRDLADHVASGKILLDKFNTLSNEEIVAELTAVKGIGEWTVHMFLIFCMGRTDILPVGDLGIKNGIRKLYGLKAQPTAIDIVRLAEDNHWHPYESIASWYVWQSLKMRP